MKMDAKSEPNDTENKILMDMAAKLKRYDIRQGHYPETGRLFRRAAVLLPLTVQNGQILLLLTKRSKDLRTHPSAVAFPGGRRENSDTSDIDTALREAEEEIGLDPSSVKVLAVLTRGITLPNNVVYPVVGFIPNDFQPKINPHEVEDTFFIPLKEFLSDKVTLYNIKIQGRDFETLSLNYDNGEGKFFIFGFTMLQCIQLARIIFDQNADEMIRQMEGYFDHVCQNVKSASQSRL